jgi:superfamily II DNA or RNA helicase
MREYTYIEAQILSQTPKAWKVVSDAGQYWLPKSAVRSAGKGGYHVPLWLAEAKGIYPRVISPAKPSAAGKISVPEMLPHQQEAFAKVSQYFFGALYLEMGTGKTKIALELAKARASTGEISQVIWAAPLQTITNAVAEIEKQGGADLEFKFVGLDSLSLSVREFNESLEFVRRKPTMLIVDEAHWVKNGDTWRNYRCIEIAKHCVYRYALSGTPVPRSPADLWGQMAILDPSLSIVQGMSQEAFERRFIVKDKGRVIGYSDKPQLYASLEPVWFTCTKQAVLNLPAKLQETIHVKLSEETVVKYHDTKHQILNKWFGGNSVNMVYELFTALQQIISGQQGDWTATVPDKLVAVRNWSLSLKEPKVIYCRYHHEVDWLAKHLPGAIPYDGRTPAQARPEILANWRKSQDALVCNIAVAGLGIDLTHSSKAAFVSNSFNFSERIQAEDRLHRMGQSHPVTYVDFSTSMGIDTIIHKCLSTKLGLHEFIHNSKNWRETI